MILPRFFHEKPSIEFRKLSRNVPMNFLFLIFRHVWKLCIHLQKWSFKYGKWWESTGIAGTIWLFNITMENDPFIDDFPIKTSIYSGFSMAMLNYQRVHICEMCPAMSSQCGLPPNSKLQTPNVPSLAIFGELPRWGRWSLAAPAKSLQSRCKVMGSSITRV